MSSSSSQAVDAEKRRDPQKCLPPEVFDLVLTAVSFPAVQSLRLVSRTWNTAVSDFVNYNPAAYAYLDFRQYDLDRVTPQLLLRYIHNSRGMTTSVLFPCHSTKNVHYSTLRAMIFLHQTLSERSYNSLTNALKAKKYWLWTDDSSTSTSSSSSSEEEEDQTGYRRYGQQQKRTDLIGSMTAELSCLTGLAIDNLYFVIRQWNDSGINQITPLYRLQELHISAHALPMLIAFIRTKRKEPLLPNLQILQCWSDYDARSRLNVPHWLEGGALVDEFAAFPELLEFRIGDYSNNSNYNTTKEQEIDQDCLDIIPEWMPKLEVLSCCGVNVRPSRYPDRRDYVHRMDLRRAANLRVLDLSYTKTWIMPFVSPKCRKLILRGAGFGAVDLSNSVLNGADVDAATEARQTAGLPGVESMYKGLEVLDLSASGAVLTNSALINILTLCDGERLQTLELQSCMRLEFGKHWSELMEQIVETCPGLRRLNVSKNSSVSDGDLVALAELGRLEEVDLSGTSVTDHGLRTLAQGDGRLRRVVVGSCPDVSRKAVERMEKQGVITS
ncbi:hypothetical protein BZA70DRAFT_71247 [Myxozyma melibiosi]|uniref:F-box domain-containing protein n=1 Tax=Myxozyma melibiosi TaxID=54550 RepID=A0ABR1F1G0_9ASCO